MNDSVGSDLPCFPGVGLAGSEERYLLQLDAGVRIPVFWKLTFGFDLYDKYDSRPTTQTRKNDFGFLSKFGYTF